MARGMPSMTALLALLAVAGYQNRDKIAEMLRGAGGAAGAGGPQPARGPAGEAGQRGGAGAEGGLGGMLDGGLRELVDRFRGAGEAETAESWVRSGPNRPLSPDQLERAVGGDTIDIIASQTGMSRQEVLARLTRELPDAVDRYTPEGRLPQ